MPGTSREVEYERSGAGMILSSRITTDCTARAVCLTRTLGSPCFNLRVPVAADEFHSYSGLKFIKSYDDMCIHVNN